MLSTWKHQGNKLHICPDELTQEKKVFKYEGIRIFLKKTIAGLEQTIIWAGHYEIMATKPASRTPGRC
jgi:hypothetical protein